jgi:hypothetical protein
VPGGTAQPAPNPHVCTSGTADRLNPRSCDYEENCHEDVRLIAARSLGVCCRSPGECRLESSGVLAAAGGGTVTPAGPASGRALSRPRARGRLSFAAAQGRLDRQRIAPMLPLRDGSMRVARSSCARTRSGGRAMCGGPAAIRTLVLADPDAARALLASVFREQLGAGGCRRRLGSIGSRRRGAEHRGRPCAGERLRRQAQSAPAHGGANCQQSNDKSHGGRRHFQCGVCMSPALRAGIAPSLITAPVASVGAAAPQFAANRFE